MKLIFNLDKSLVQKAKIYADFNGQTLSQLVENYLKVVIDKETIKSDIELTPIVKSLKGAFKSDENFVYKEELIKSLEKKYL